ncbi:MAG: ArsR/SmtB family transcription factor [Dehalococcoidia bacterium]
MLKAITGSLASPGQTELLARFFRGLSDPTRLRMVDYLLGGERSVAELVKLVGAPQGRVSSHLAYLKWCSVVTSRRRGRNVYYSVVDERTADLLSLVQAILIRHVRHLASLAQIE